MFRFLLPAFTLLLSACSSYEKSDMIGSWETIEVTSEVNVGGLMDATFKFNTDETFVMESSEGKLTGTYYWWGNTLHLVNNENIDWPISVQNLSKTEMKLELTRADTPIVITLQKTD